MGKSEVYSWRLSPGLKADLEEAARHERKSVAELLDQIAQDWVERWRDLDPGGHERQQRLREAVANSIGALQGANPRRAEGARSEIRSRLARRHAR
jgi:hypothetical protein